MNGAQNRPRGPGRYPQASHAPAVFSMGIIVPWEPDLMTVDQWFGRMRVALRQPEQVLQLAVLEDAVTVLTKAVTLRIATVNGIRRETTHPSETVRAEAREWCLDDAEDAFSFVGICESLGLSASYLRRGLGLLGGDPPAPRVGRMRARDSVVSIAHGVRQAALLAPRLGLDVATQTDTGTRAGVVAAPSRGRTG